MRLRWPKILPRFPAILLMPIVLAIWALLTVHSQGQGGMGWFALTVAWALAMAVERLVFPLARRLHGKKPEQGEAG
ncbi:MAG: hypothetical protein O7H41_03385 [Planctomycetota bacterium]|nr:hypothetical protein [Planctomycetota bacterium]